MGIEWHLFQSDKGELPPDRGQAFDPGPFNPEEIDALLVGSTSGPLAEFFLGRTEISNDGSRSLDLMSSAAVKEFAERLKGFDRSNFAAPETVLNESIHSVSGNNLSAYYRHLIEITEQLQKFISESASEDRGVLLEVLC